MPAVEGAKVEDVVVFEKGKKVGITSVVEVDARIISPELISPTTVVNIEFISTAVVINFMTSNGPNNAEAVDMVCEVVVVKKLVNTTRTSILDGCSENVVSTLVARSDEDPQPYWRYPPG